MRRNFIDLIFKLIVFSLVGMAGCGGGSDNGTIALPPALTDNNTLGNLTASAGSAVVSILPNGNSSYTVQGSAMDGVAGIQLDITYDATSLSSPTVTQGGLVAGAMFASNTSRPGFIKIAIISTQPFSGSGQIAIISFASKTGSGGITSITTSMIDGRGTAISAVSQTPNSTQTTTQPIAPIAPTVNNPVTISPVSSYQLPTCGGEPYNSTSIVPTLDTSLKKGVIFKHSTHTTAQCCSCHSENPGKIAGFGKDWAHNICKGCHTSAQKGPTSCKGCHLS